MRIQTRWKKQRDSYTHPQCSACFIQSVDDDLMSIFDLAKNEARIFKYGSGSGTNFSNRAEVRQNRAVLVDLRFTIVGSGQLRRRQGGHGGVRPGPGRRARTLRHLGQRGLPWSGDTNDGHGPGYGQADAEAGRGRVRRSNGQVGADHRDRGALGGSRTGEQRSQGRLPRQRGRRDHHGSGDRNRRMGDGAVLAPPRRQEHPQALALDSRRA